MTGKLAGKLVCLGVTGSIAAVRCVELARLLGRAGAVVQAVMTPESQKILHPEALKFATGRNVITGLTGAVEHIQFCGENGRADLLLVAPATANTINKIAGGIGDTPVTAFALSALNNIPVVLAPAMHVAMYQNRIVQENLTKLKTLGVKIIPPLLEEGAAKLQDNKVILLEVERLLGGQSLQGKQILITGGTTREKIDPIRVITTPASGKTGIELALEAYRRGANVTLVHNSRLGTPGIKEIKTESREEMTRAVLEELEQKRYDLLISTAAISDFTPHPVSEHKIPSNTDLTLQLKPAPKLLGEVRKRHPNLKMVGFKAETNLPPQELIEKAAILQKRYNLLLVAANDTTEGGMGGEKNHLYLVADNNSVEEIQGTKKELAAALLDRITPHLLEETEDGP